MSHNPAAPAAPGGPANKKSPRQVLTQPVGLEISSGPVESPERIVIYGTGGIGKSTLAAYLPGPLFLDVERGTTRLNVARDISIETWDQLRGKLASIKQTPPAGVKTIVIDTATVAEELAKEFVIATRKTEKGRAVDSIEGYGWGKGWQFVADEFNGLLADLDRLLTIGMNVCLICHEVSTPVPNPAGEDFIRWEPHLFGGDKKGRGSIRERVKQWADHVLYVGYDVFVSEGKGTGSGTRTIYTSERPTHLAKSRGTQAAIVFDQTKVPAIWEQLGIKQ